MEANVCSRCTLESLYKKYKKGIFNFMYVLQRDGGQWTINQKNMLIDSILNGFVIPQIWVLEEREPKKYIVIDGKQRMSTIFSYINNEWKLAKTFAPVYLDDEYYDVAGKKFSELDPKIQSLINDYDIELFKLTGYTEEQLEEQFMRLNSGTPFKPTQKERVALGTQIAPKFDEKILNLAFWDRCTPSVANSKTDAKLGIALECLMLLTDYECKGYGSAEIQKFAQYFRENYNEAAVDELAMLLEKLDEYYPTDDECVPLLKKLHIPALVMCMKMFLKIQNGEVKFNEKVKFSFAEEDFEKWLYEWSTKMYRGEYSDKGCQEGTTKKDKVKARVEIICDRLLGAAENKMIDYIRSVKGDNFDWEHGDYSFLNEETETVSDDNIANNVIAAEIIEETEPVAENTEPMTVDDILDSMDLDEEVAESNEKWGSDIDVQTDEGGACYNANAS